MRPAFIKPYVSPTFPDFSSNYKKTIVEPQRAIEQEQQVVPVVGSTPAIQAPITPPIASTDPMIEIFNRESGNNPSSVNISSGACGLGQAYPCSKMPCSLTDYNCQVTFFTAYAVARYGGWPQAWMHWQQYNSW